MERLGGPVEAATLASVRNKKEEDRNELSPYTTKKNPKPAQYASSMTEKCVGKYFGLANSDPNFGIKVKYRFCGFSSFKNPKTKSSFVTIGQVSRKSQWVSISFSPFRPHVQELKRHNTRFPPTHDPPHVRKRKLSQAK